MTDLETRSLNYATDYTPTPSPFKKKDFLGREIDPNAPPAKLDKPIDDTWTDRWLAAHKAEQAAPEITIPVPPPPAPTAELLAKLAAHRQTSGHFPIPTADESAAWLAAHQASEGADDSTIPFVRADGKALTMATNLHPPTTVKADSPYKPSGAAITGRCTRVAWAWNKALAAMQGYDLTIDGKVLTFGKDETEDIPFYLPTPITCEADRVSVDWLVTYRDGRIFRIEERKMNQTVDPSILNEALGRDPDECAPWVNDDKLRGSFFGDYDKLCNKYQVEDDKDKREAIRKAVLKRTTGRDTLKAWKTTTTALLAALEMELRRLGYKQLDQTTGKPATDEKPTMPVAGPTTALNSTETNTEPTPQSETSKPALAPETRSEGGNGSTADKPTEPANIIPFPKLPTTLTGISVLEISRRLDDHLPPQAYSAIKFGQMSGKTDIDGDRVRDRFDLIFGPMGIGWRIMPHPTAGKVECRSEVRTKTDQSSGEIKDQTWHVVTLVAHTLQYTVIMPDGSFQWVDASTTSDQHDNMDEQYAYRGAMTSLMKQFYRLMGGMNHIMYNQYTHVHAQKELNRKSA